jgi:hypothetical protein
MTYRILEDNVPRNATPEEYERAVIQQSLFEKTQYARLRASEYPSIVDQLDLLYHGGYDAWKTAIQAVKTKYPKSTE